MDKFACLVDSLKFAKNQMNWFRFLSVKTKLFVFLVSIYGCDGGIRSITSQGQANYHFFVNGPSLVKPGSELVVAGEGFGTNIRASLGDVSLKVSVEGNSQLKISIPSKEVLLSAVKTWIKSPSGLLEAERQLKGGDLGNSPGFLELKIKVSQDGGERWLTHVFVQGGEKEVVVGELQGAGRERVKARAIA